MLNLLLCFIPMPYNSSIIVADNQAITNAGIKRFAQQVLNVSRLDDAHNKRELVELLTASPDTIAVLDYTNFDFRDIEDFLILHNRFPQTTWILFSTILSEQFLRRVAAEENVSIILKDCDAHEICDALSGASNGVQYLCQQVKTLLSTAPQHQELAGSLTPTEIEVLKLIAQGNSVKEIAAKRVSSVHTITTHKKNIFLKIGVNNVYEATKYALRAGLLELMEYYI